MDLYVASALAPFHLNTSAAIGTFTTFQDILQNPAGTNIERPILYGRQLRVGAKLELEAWGEFSTTGTPTLGIGFWLGTAATVLCQSGSITTGSGAAAWPWHARATVLITSIAGTSGTAWASGILDLGTSLTAFASSAMPVTASARSLTGLDFSVNKEVGVGAVWGTSSASNTIKVGQFQAVLLN